MTEKRTPAIPIEIRVWLPDGVTLRIRARLDEFMVDKETFGGFMQVDDEYTPIAREYRIVAHGPGWRMDRRGKPVVK